MYVVMHCIRFWRALRVLRPVPTDVSWTSISEVSLCFSRQANERFTLRALRRELHKPLYRPGSEQYRTAFNLAPKDLQLALQLAIWIPFFISGRLPCGRECHLESAPFSPLLPFYSMSSAVQAG